MNIKDIILKRIKENGRATVSEVVRKTGLSRAYIHRFFQALCEAGTIVKIGHANQACYVANNFKSVQKAKLHILSFQRVFPIKNLQEDLVLDLIKSETGILNQVTENTNRIIEYAFTEMLNNAIEHSRSERVGVVMRRDEDLIRFDVTDRGIGIFENLIHSRHLASVEEAIQDLLKGKQTTKPEEHSGEGIFFTRRVADLFIIRSSEKKILFNNLINDFTITTIKPIKGTRITFTIANNSKKELKDIFATYTSEFFEFGTTEVLVKLYRPGDYGNFVSRSQARRVLSGLDKFKKIVLDFKNVKAIGQGFADEIFRIWQLRHKDIKIDYTDANEDVLFMIKRSKINV